MSSEKTPQTLQERVLGPINNGEIKMTPRWHFLLHTIFITFGAIVIILTLFYITSFIFFILNRTGLSSAPNFGARGWYAFLVSFPWLLVALCGLCIILLEILVRHTAFAYRRPILYSTVGIIILVIGGGFLIAITPLHRDLANYSDAGKLPLGGMLYRHFEELPPGNVHHGQIIHLMEQGFQMRNHHSENLTVIVSPRTRLPYGADFSPGDLVVVFGDRDNNTIEAYGIREVQE
jgi:hypothetical protein